MAKKIASENGSGVVRVLVAAASAIRRAGLEAVIKAAPELKLVGSAPGVGLISAQAISTAVLANVRALEPHVLLLDFDRPPRPFGLSQLFATLSFPEAARPAIIALVDAPSPVWAARALRSGVKSILPRDAPDDEIVSAIHAAHAGLVLLDSAAAQEMARHVHAESTEDAAFDDLTARETEILRMLAEGLGNKQIAVALGISEHTVKFHISSILDKLGAATRTEAVTSGIRMGLIFV